jgi:fructoselysine-6-P-deglycase FrlB-like protein
MDLRWASAGLGSEDGVVAASVSGRTPRTVEALQRALARGAAGLVISDDSQAPLASLTTERCILSTTQPEQLAAHVYAGYASEVPQTRTYLAVLSLMCELALGGKGQEPVLPAHFVDNLERQLEAWLGRAVQLAKTMVESAPVARITVLGSGPYFATACYGAAKHLEYAIPAGAQCLEEFHHLQMFVVEEGDWIVGLAPDAASLQRWQEVRNHYRALGARTVEWTVEPEGGLLPSSLLEAVFACTVVLQLQAYALAWQLGRDLQKWVGGRRRDLIFALSQATVRDSRVWLQD